jgi:hypothetical protein
MLSLGYLCQCLKVKLSAQQPETKTPLLQDHLNIPLPQPMTTLS